MKRNETASICLFFRDEWVSGVIGLGRLVRLKCFMCAEVKKESYTPFTIGGPANWDPGPRILTEGIAASFCIFQVIVHALNARNEPPLLVKFLQV